MIKKLFLWCKRIFFVAWCFAMIIVGMWMLHENKTPVNVNYLDVWQQEQSLGMVIFEMLFIGFIMGFLTNVFSAKTRVFWHKRKFRKASQELAKLKHIQAQE